MTTLSIVIPAYNEEASIVAVVSRVLAIRPALRDEGIHELELIVVDDGSKDATRELVRKMPDVRLLCHARNGGYGAALKTGFAAAQGEYIGFLDADGTYPPEHFPNLYRAARQQNADIVIGSRMSGAASEMPAVRRLGNFIFANLVSLLAAERITDSASGMRIFKKSILERVYPLPDGLNLTPVMSTRALHERLKMIEVSIPYSERAGRSKLSVVHDGMRFAESIIWTAMSYNPVRLLGMAGALLMLIALLVGLAFVTTRVQGVTEIGPVGVYALFTGLILAVCGVSLFSLGAMYNYLVSLFYKEPIRQGLFGRPLFKAPLDRQFGWLGLLAMVVGTGVGILCLVLSLNGWPITRLYFWLLPAAMSFVIGLQLLIGWLIMRSLEQLSRREAGVASDMLGKRIEDYELQPTN